jgi:hypothetical protein
VVRVCLETLSSPPFPKDLSVYSPLNSPLYTTFPLFTPLSAIIFPTSPHLSPPVFGRKKSPDRRPGLVGIGLLTAESHVDSNALLGERLMMYEVPLCEVNP